MKVLHHTVRLRGMDKTHGTDRPDPHGHHLHHGSLLLPGGKGEQLAISVRMAQITFYYYLCALKLFRNMG